MLVEATSVKTVADRVFNLLKGYGFQIDTYNKEGEVVGQGTGDLKTHLDALKENNIKLYVSGMSAKARGYDDSLLNGFNAESSMLDKLISPFVEAASVLC